MTSVIIGPRRGGIENRLPDTQAARRFIGPHNSIRYATLMDAGIVPNLDELDGRSMFEALRRIVPYDGTKHSCATIVFGSSGSLDVETGMPAHEAAAYLAGTAFMEEIEAAIEEALAANAGPAHPPRIRVRVDVTFTTRSATEDLRPGVPPTARLGGPDMEEEVSVPRIYHGSPTLVHNTAAGLRAYTTAYVDAFRDYVEDVMQQMDSARALGYLVSANVWATPVLAAAAGAGVMIGGSTRFASIKHTPTVLKDSDTLATQGQIDGQFIVPHAIYNCHGIVLNDPSQRDLVCISRAIMTALDPLLESRSDANWVVLLRDALEGAENIRASYARQAVLKTSSDVISSKRASLLDIATRRVEQLRKEVMDAVVKMKEWGRHVRVDGSDPSRYRSRSRYKEIERNRVLALKGIHPLIDFRDPIFSTHTPINSETVSRIRACVRKGALVKIQFWGVGCEDKIALNFPDPGATLEFLEKGGRVLNIFYGYQHASYAVDISSCCNHKVGKGKDRSYCGLCGFFCSKGTTGDKLHVYEHQRKGCPTTSYLEMTAPLSYANRRQLSKRNYVALERPLLVGFYGTESTTLKNGTYWTKNASLQLFTRGRDHWMPFERPLIFHKSLLPAEQMLWVELVSTRSVDAILSQLHWSVPKDPDSLAQLRSSLERGDNPPCHGCMLPVRGPTAWDIQEIVLEDTDEEVEDDEDLSIDRGHLNPCEDTGEDFVEHHCHATGQVHAAHVNCNSLIRQSGNTLILEVLDVAAMAVAVEILFSKAFIELYCYKAKPPVMYKRGNEIQRITFRVAGTPRHPNFYEMAAKRKAASDAGAAFFEEAASKEFMPRVLTIVLRPISLFLDPHVIASDFPIITPPLGSPSSYKNVCSKAMAYLEWAEREFIETGLWAPAFATRISYGRNLLYRMAKLPPGVTPTSLVSESTLASLKKMTTGGMIVLGEQAEWFPLEKPLNRQVARLYLDTTAAYPVQLMRWPIPLLEHADRMDQDYSGKLEDGIQAILKADLCGDTMRVELWGAFPPETHAFLNAMPPLIERREIKGSDLSQFQRTFMKIEPSKSMGMRTVNHLWPVEGLIVFARTAQILLKLGFKPTRVGRVWITPSAYWCKEFALKGEARRAAARRNRILHEGTPGGAFYKGVEESVKAVYNSVIGSLNMDVSKFTTLSTEKDYVTADEAEAAETVGFSLDRLSIAERYADDPRFTMRVFQAQNTTLYELKKKKIVHNQSTLAALFVMEMARDDMLELWYGTHAGNNKGILDAFPSARLLYGCTDSLIVEIQSAGDARKEFMCHFHERVDLTNVPRDSTMFSYLSYEDKDVQRNAGKWGFLKEETGFAGVDALIVNGPNRWGCRVVQSDTDTPPKFKGKSSDILKSLPRAWKEEATLEMFAASWYCEDPVVPPVITDTEAPKHTSVSVWGNRSCIVSRTPPYRHYALGSQMPEAIALVTGTEW